MSGAWEVVIGLEIHAQLATNSKIFSGASTAYGAEPNTQACLVDLGYPGVLPVLNKEVVRMACKFGLAVNATVAPRAKTERGVSSSSPARKVMKNASASRGRISKRTPASLFTKASTVIPGSI